VFDILKKLAENPTVDKYYIEQVNEFEDPNGVKYPIEIKEAKPSKTSTKSK
jgi:hypothetical protein